jgi:phytoene dehydrogenase-like protein
MFLRAGRGRWRSRGSACMRHDRRVRFASRVTFTIGLRITSMEQLPQARVLLFDVSPHALARIATHLPTSYRRRLLEYRYGPAAFKVDWALTAPIPWRAQECRRAAVVHIGDSFDDVADAEQQIANNTMPGKPFILVAQPSLFDRTRAPTNQHTAWAYAHVPHGYEADVTSVIEARIEEMAPGLRDTILARAARSPAMLERENPNYVGGDIVGGVGDAGQLFFRPVARVVPYATPDPRIFLCSASTPPGAGVHGMCGFHAARVALARLRLSP